MRDHFKSDHSSFSSSSQSSKKSKSKSIPLCKSALSKDSSFIDESIKLPSQIINKFNENNFTRKLSTIKEQYNNITHPQDSGSGFEFPHPKKNSSQYKEEQQRQKGGITIKKITTRKIINTSYHIENQEIYEQEDNGESDSPSNYRSQSHDDMNSRNQNAPEFDQGSTRPFHSNKPNKQSQFARPSVNSEIFNKNKPNYRVNKPSNLTKPKTNNPAKNFLISRKSTIQENNRRPSQLVQLASKAM